MIDHLTRVVLDAVDERRLAPPEHGQPEGVQTGAVDDAAVVAEPPLGIDHGHVEPPVIGPKPRRPDDRADLAAPEVELQPRRSGHLRRCAALGGIDLGIQPLGPSPLVEHSEQPSHLQVRERADVAQAAGEQRAAVTDGRAASHELDADRDERVEIERRPLGCPDELRRGQLPRPPEIVELVVALVPDAGRVHPPQDIAAAIGPRQPHVLSRPTGSPAGPIASARPPAALRSPTPRRRARLPRGVARGCGSQTASAARPPPAPPAQSRAPSDGCRHRSRSPPCASGSRRGSWSAGSRRRCAAPR